MKPSNCLYGIVALALGVCSTSVLAEPPYAAEPAMTNEALTLAIIVKVDRSSGEIAYQWSVLEVESGKAKLRPIRETVQLSLAGYLLYDATGKKLAVGDFIRRAGAGEVILISHGGRLPDPRYLRVLKDDTLILLRGQADTTPIPAGHNPPPGYVPNPR